MNEFQREIDELYMRRALALAAMGCGYTNPNPMVGAVIVKGENIIGEGYHMRCGEGHAEVNAFANCTEDPAGATIYVTLEPCSHHGKTPPCADLIISKKIARVVVGALDPNPLVAGRGIKRIEDAGIDVVTGVLAEESVALNSIFMHYIKEKNPYVLLKTAMSLDGKIATKTGESQWISCEESRAHSQTLRNQYMAIMVGVQTVIADNPQLTCRCQSPDGRSGKNPIRIVVDTHLRSPLDFKIFECDNERKTVLAVGENTLTCKRDACALLQSKGVEIIECPEVDGHVDIKWLIQELGQRGIDSILVEGGATLADAVVRSGEVNEVIAYIAPTIIGGSDAKTPVGGIGVEHLNEALSLSNVQVEKIGCDVVIHAKVC